MELTGGSESSALSFEGVTKILDRLNRTFFLLLFFVPGLSNGSAFLSWSSILTNKKKQNVGSVELELVNKILAAGYHDDVEPNAIFESLWVRYALWLPPLR